MNKSARDYLALPLDNCAGLDTIRSLVDATRESVGVFKIGLEQFTRYGPVVVEHIRSAGRRIFLDLKLHDIPNTVGKAVEAASGHGVDILTVHTQGGEAMLRAAVNAAAGTDHAPTIVGVTLLTSIDARALRDELAVELSTGAYVKQLALLAARAGLGGIVCSAADLPDIRPSLPGQFEIITPGIRLANDSVDDQKRVATPELAIQQGATLLVVGRPITAAANPAAAARKFVEHIEAQMGG